MLHQWRLESRICSGNFNSKMPGELTRCRQLDVWRREAPQLVAWGPTWVTKMLRKLPSVTIYETPWQPPPNARAVSADTEAPLRRSSSSDTMSPYLSPHTPHSHSQTGFLTGASQMSRLLTAQYHRSRPSWSSDATELPTAHVFLKSKQKDGLESGLKTLNFCFSCGPVVERPGRSCAWADHSRRWWSSQCYKASEPGRQDSDLGWCYRVPLP